MNLRPEQGREQSWAVVSEWRDRWQTAAASLHLQREAAQINKPPRAGPSQRGRPRFDVVAARSSAKAATTHLEFKRRTSAAATAALVRFWADSEAERNDNERAHAAKQSPPTSRQHDNNSGSSNHNNERVANPRRHWQATGGRVPPEVDSQRTGGRI